MNFTLDEAHDRLTAREFQAFCWLWFLTARFGQHPAERREAAGWRGRFDTDDAATDMAEHVLAHRNNG